MLLHTRDKQVYINPVHVTALSQCSPIEKDTLGANCCIHTVNQTFLVKETFLEVYSYLTGNAVIFQNKNAEYLETLRKAADQVPTTTKATKTTNVTTSEGVLRVTGKLPTTPRKPVK